MGMLRRDGPEQPEREQGRLPETGKSGPSDRDGSVQPALPAACELRDAHVREALSRAQFRWRWAYKVTRRIFRLRKYFWQLGELLKTFKDVKAVPKSRPK